MRKENLLIKCILLLICLPITNVFAQSQLNHSQQNTAIKAAQQFTPVESFIRHVGETNQFVQVNNIWQADNNFDQTLLLQNVEKVQPLTIDYAAVVSLIQKNTTAISLVVPGINGGIYTIDLAQYNPLSNDFKVNGKAGDVETPFNYTPGKYYSGVVKGIPGSIAAFSFFKNEVYGIFSIPGVGNLVLVPNSMVRPSYDYNQNYILYNDNELKIKNRAPKCATDQLNLDYLNNAAYKTTISTTTLNNNVYNTCNEVNVMELGDFAFYQTEGSNLANATNYLTALFNNEAIIYRNEGIIINLKYVQINQTSDVYQTLANSSTAFLNAFGDDIQNTYKTTHGCNVAMLATTMWGSNMGGVAWVQAMCGSYSAGSHFDGTAISNIDNGALLAFPTYSWNVEVLSHEMGHNVGSRHTHACVWNPQYTGTTAIDGCYTLEGSCSIPVPALPPAGGTIMSYCHLTAAGINFSNGFGPQPGSVIRDYINGTGPVGYNAPAGCAPGYYSSIALSTANRTISANRECTDPTSGITYYWKDNNTADQSDDTLVLMIKKGANNIGDLNTAGFSVTANTIVRYGTGTGDTLTFPSGTSASIMAQNYGMRRYWKITPTSAPATAVEVMFPFLSTDTSDVHGSVLSGPAPLSSYLMYKTNGGIDPNPANGFPGATSGNFAIYTYSTTPTVTNWSLSTVGATQLAHMMMTNLAGGGTGFFTYCTPHAAPTPGTVPAAQCPGAIVTYSVTPDPSALSFTWTVSGTGWVGTSTTNSINLTVGSGVGTISVKANDTCGTGISYTFPAFTPLPLPSETIASTTPLCVGALTAGFAATVTTGSPVLSYTWNATGTGWSPSGSTTGPTFTANVGTGAGTITVRATNACGLGPITTFTAILSASIPAAPTSITPPALVCPSGSGIFTTPAIPGASFYNWTVAGTGWSAAAPSLTTSININIGTGTGTLTVSASNGCGTSAIYSRNISTSSGPGTATAISGPATPCSGSNATLTTPAVPTATSYSWVVTGTGWSGSSSTNSINVIVGSGAGIITVTPINACGVGGSYTTTITASPSPTSTFALSSHIVQAHSNVIAFYTGSAPVGSTFTWSFPGGVGSPGTGSGAQTVYWNTPGQYLIFLTVANGAGCSSAYADTVDVTYAAGLQNLNIQKIDASIVPNPNNGEFDILFSDPVTQPVSVKLFDMQGRKVYNNDFTDAINKKIPIETNNLPPGTYIVTIYVNESAISKKITIFK